MNSTATDGLLDTNIFIHAHTHDTHAEECQRFLAALEHGRIHAHLEPVVLHELSYTLPRYVKQMTRDDIAAYMVMVPGWPGVRGNKDAMLRAVGRWWRTPGLAFVDAYLATIAVERGCPVYTKNVRELTGQGVVVPDPLPTAPSAS